MRRSCVLSSSAIHDEFV